MDGTLLIIILILASLFLSVFLKIFCNILCRDVDSENLEETATHQTLGNRLYRQQQQQQQQQNNHHSPNAPIFTIDRSKTNAYDLPPSYEAATANDVVQGS